MKRKTIVLTIVLAFVATVAIITTAFVVRIEFFRLDRWGPSAFRKVKETKVLLPENLAFEFENADMEQIEWYLASSKEWTIIRDGDMVIVYDAFDDVYPIMSAADARVYMQGFEDLGGPRSPYQRVDATDEAIKVKVYATRIISDLLEYDWLYGLYFSNIVLKFSETFYVQISELSYDRNCTRTIAAIEEIARFFAPQAEQENYLRHNGSISHAGEVLNVLSGSRIEGYVHLDKKNTCSIRYVDAVTGEPYDNLLTDPSNQFCIGWSDDEDEYFYFHQTLFQSMDPDAPETADVIVQLWVEDEDGSRCVLEKRATIEF